MQKLILFLCISILNPSQRSRVAGPSGLLIRYFLTIKFFWYKQNMPKKKQIKLYNDGGVQYYPDHKIPWSDTWVKFFIGRKRISFGPTILGLLAIQDDIEAHARWRKAGYEWASIEMDPVLPIGDWKFCFIYTDGPDHLGCPNIAVNSEMLDKQLIEEAIEWFIRQRYTFNTKFNFKWKNNREKFFINPW